MINFYRNIAIIMLIIFLISSRGSAAVLNFEDCSSAPISNYELPVEIESYGGHNGGGHHTTSPDKPSWVETFWDTYGKTTEEVGNTFLDYTGDGEINDEDLVEFVFGRNYFMPYQNGYGTQLYQQVKDYLGGVFNYYKETDDIGEPLPEDTPLLTNVVWSFNYISYIHDTRVSYYPSNTSAREINGIYFSNPKQISYANYSRNYGYAGLNYGAISDNEYFCYMTSFIANNYGENLPFVKGSVKFNFEFDALNIGTVFANGCDYIVYVNGSESTNQSFIQGDHVLIVCTVPDVSFTLYGWSSYGDYDFNISIGAIVGGSPLAEIPEIPTLSSPNRNDYDNDVDYQHDFDLWKQVQKLLPLLNLPDVDLPNVDLPNVDLPSIDIPNVDIDAPNIGNGLPAIGTMINDKSILAYPSVLFAGLISSINDGYSPSFRFDSPKIEWHDVLIFDAVSVDIDPRQIFGGFWDFVTYVFVFLLTIPWIVYLFKSIRGWSSDNE